jgi:predicted ATPase
MVLATSREALGVEGETTYELRPLPTPPSDASTQVDSLMSNDAIRLFVERARAVKRGFALTSETAPVVAELCQRLDGIPLAIELAAARLQLMAPAEVLARLDERFRVLAGGRRTALERHQTLRGAIDWSYALLGPAEQLLFARLSVFVGGFTLGAAEAVASGEGVEGRDALSVLGSLVAKSMVVTDDIDAGTRRYRLLDTLRAYASERLGELDDPVRVRARHAGFFLELAETAAGELKGPDDEKWYLVLNSEEDNVRAALGWARDIHPTRAWTGVVLVLQLELPAGVSMASLRASACVRDANSGARRAPWLRRPGGQRPESGRGKHRALPSESRALARVGAAATAARECHARHRRARVGATR